MAKHMQRRVRFYHATRHRFSVGDLIVPQGSKRGVGVDPWSLGDVVFMTTSPIPHYTMIRHIEGSDEEWHIYEVEPRSRVYHGNCWDEAGCDFATVIRYVGSGRGILNNAYRTFRKKEGLSARFGFAAFRGSAVKTEKGLNRTK